MSVQFECRALAEEPYRETVDLLDRAAGGDRSSFDTLRRRARSVLDDAALQARNCHGHLLGLWRDWLDRASLAPDGVERLGQIAVAVLALPEFQLAYSAGPDRATTLVVLGDEDGGLFGVMTGRLPWFEPWLVAGLSQRPERRGYGRAMFRMSPEERSRLEASLAGLDGDCGQAPSPVHCRETLARLAQLLQRVADTPGWTSVVCETG